MSAINMITFQRSGKCREMETFCRLWLGYATKGLVLAQIRRKLRKDDLCTFHIKQVLNL
jgi:hypothetical protein